MKEQVKPYVLLFPMLIILVGIFMTGIFMGLIQSFGYFKIVGLTGFTWRYYREVLTSAEFLDSLQFSFYTSFISSVIAIICGVTLAYCIHRWKGKKELVEAVYKVPIVVPHLVAIVLVTNILSQTGFFPRVLYGIGLIEEPSQFPSLLYEKNGVGIMLAYIWKEVPFVVLTTYTILSRLSHTLDDVAYNLGANKSQVFFHVQLPLLLPSIFSTFIIIFAFAFGAYEVPLLLGPTQPKALAVQAFIEYTNPVLQNRPYAMVFNMVITFISLMMTGLYFQAFKKLSTWTR